MRVSVALVAFLILVVVLLAYYEVMRWTKVVVESVDTTTLQLEQRLTETIDEKIALAMQGLKATTTSTDANLKDPPPGSWDDDLTSSEPLTEEWTESFVASIPIVKRRLSPVLEVGETETDLDDLPTIDDKTDVVPTVEPTVPTEPTEPTVEPTEPTIESTEPTEPTIESTESTVELTEPTEPLDQEVTDVVTDVVTDDTLDGPAKSTRRKRVRRQ
jgi:serine-aspartate repeat-containing protein C/D/E